MRARRIKQSDVLSASVAAALATPARGLGAERAGLEDRLGGDLSALRIHEGPAVDRSAALLDARGFAVGRDVAIARNAGPLTLAHEAAHALQQDLAEPHGTVPVTGPADHIEREAQAAARGAGPVGRGQPPALSRDLTDPNRLAEVHHEIRVEGPPQPAPSGTAPAPRRPWVDGPVSDSHSTAHLLYHQIYTFLDNRTFPSTGATHTTAANLDADAVAMHQRVIAHFPQISSPLSDAEIQARVSLVTPATVAAAPHFLDQWMDNFINQMSDSAQYQIDRTNTNYRAMITRLINDPDVGPKIAQLGARTSAFTTGEGTARHIFVHPRVTDLRRRTTLIHEIIHLYRHSRYSAWVAASLDGRFYNEGITEWLAQRVMTSAERATRTGHHGYEDRVRVVQRQIAANVSEDGIARAYFLGEVWRLETRSAEARAAFGAQTGIQEGGTRAEERAAAHTSAGFVQTVAGGQHYRFINLGIDEAKPKPEHETAFREIKTREFDPRPSVKLRFVGYASSPGSETHNMALSLRRSVAFYRMARRDGVPWARMVDANRPPHFGEARPSVTEEDVITRAMNRRVEMFLIAGGTP